MSNLRRGRSEVAEGIAAAMIMSIRVFKPSCKSRVRAVSKGRDDSWRPDAAAYMQA